jgi:chromosome segregation ATPase
LSTLGKILTVLVALVSIAVAVLVAREFVLTQNWKASYDQQAKLTADAMTELANAVDSRDKQATKWAEDKAAFEADINAKTIDLAARKNDIADLNKKIGAQQASLDTLVAELKAQEANLTNLVKEKDGYRAERDLAMKKADEYTVMYNEVVTRYQKAETDLGILKETLRQTSEDKAALEGQLFFIKQENPQAKLPDKAAPGPLPRVSGLVTDVDNEARTAQISLGSDSGIVAGMKFIVFSAADTKYLATLTVKKVDNKSAAGDLTVIRGTVKANDHVTNKLGE